MSSGDLHEDLSFDNISQIKTPGLLGSARSEACSNEAVSVSPKSSIDNQDSLTAQVWCYSSIRSTQLSPQQAARTGLVRLPRPLRS